MSGKESAGVAGQAPAWDKLALVANKIVANKMLAMIIDHEGFTPAIASVVCDSTCEVRCVPVIHRVDGYKSMIIREAIIKYRQPFLLVLDKNETVSNSGMHAVITNIPGVSSPSHLEVLGYVRIKRIRDFSVIGGIKEEDFKRYWDSHRGYYIAWITGGDKVNRVWELEHVDNVVRIATIIETSGIGIIRDVIKSSTRQGNLRISNVKFRSKDDMYKVQRSRIKIYNHVVQMTASLPSIFIPAVLFDLNGAVWIIMNDLDHAVDAEIRSPDHENVNITIKPETAVILYHPRPCND